LVLLFLPGQKLEKTLGKVFSRLAYVSEDEDGAFCDLADPSNIIGHCLGGAKRRVVSVKDAAEGGGGAAAIDAVMSAAATGKNCGDGIAQPALEGKIVSKVAVSDCRLHHMVIVVNHDIVKLIGHIRQRILMQIPIFISPGKVGHPFRLLALQDAVHQLAKGLLCGIASKQVVDLRVMEKLAVVVRGGEPADNYF
jgi:hypothetical protein